MKIHFSEALLVGLLVLGCMWLHDSNECKARGGHLVNWVCVAVVK